MENYTLKVKSRDLSVSSKDLRKDLSERALKRASLFSWKKTVSKMLEAFNCKKKTCSNV